MQSLKGVSGNTNRSYRKPHSSETVHVMMSERSQGLVLLTPCPIRTSAVQELVVQ